MRFCILSILFYCSLSLVFAQPSKLETFQQGQAFYEAGDYALALSVFERVANWDSRSQELNDKIRSCRSKLGMWVDTGKPIWESMDSLPIKLSRDSMRIAYNQAFLWLNAGDATRARLLSHKLMQREPADTAYALLYKQATLLQSQLRDSYISVANGFDLDGKYRLALQELRKAEYYAPSDPYIQQRRGEIEAKVQLEMDFLLKRIQESTDARNLFLQWKWLDLAQMAYPDDANIAKKQDSTLQLRSQILQGRITEGERYYHGAKFAEALAVFSSIASDYPEHPLARHWLQISRQAYQVKNANSTLDSLGRTLNLYLNQKRFTQAAKTYRKLQDLYKNRDGGLPQPDSLLVQAEYRLHQQAVQEIGKAERLLAARHYKEALVVAEAAQSISPQGSIGEGLIQRIRSEQANLALQNRDRIEKVEKMAASGEFTSISPEDLQNTGDANLDRRLAQVRQQMKSQSPTSSDKADAANRLKAAELFDQGLQYYRIGDYARAAKVWEQVLRLDPQHPKATGFLENVRKKIR